MRFYAVGLNHECTSLEQTETFALSAEEQEALYANLSLSADAEVVVLSTCNRTEAYLYGTEADLRQVKALIGQVNRQGTATQCGIRLKEAKVGERDLSARQPEELDHHVVLHTVGRHDDVTDIERRIHRPGRAGTDHGLGVERIDQNLCAEGGIHLPNARPDKDKIVPVPRRLMKGKSRPLRRAQDLAAVEIQLHFDIHRRHDGQRHTDVHLN